MVITCVNGLSETKVAYFPLYQMFLTFTTIENAHRVGVAIQVFALVLAIYASSNCSLSL